MGLIPALVAGLVLRETLGGDRIRDLAAIFFSPGLRAAIGLLAPRLVDRAIASPSPKIAIQPAAPRKLGKP